MDLHARDALYVGIHTPDPLPELTEAPQAVGREPGRSKRNNVGAGTSGSSNMVSATRSVSRPSRNRGEGPREQPSLDGRG